MEENNFTPANENIPADGTHSESAQNPGQVAGNFAAPEMMYGGAANPGIARIREMVQKIRTELHKVVVGQDEITQQA